jgi:hypothetical protein
MLCIIIGIEIDLKRQNKVLEPVTRIPKRTWFTAGLILATFMIVCSCSKSKLLTPILLRGAIKKVRTEDTEELLR